MKKTTFRDLAVGARFILPGGTVVYMKIDARQARPVRGKVTAIVTIKAGDAVVPETTPTVEDILNSWRHL